EDGRLLRFLRGEGERAETRDGAHGFHAHRAGHDSMIVHTVTTRHGSRRGLTTGSQGHREFLMVVTARRAHDSAGRPAAQAGCDSRIEQESRTPFRTTARSRFLFDSGCRRRGAAPAETPSARPSVFSVPLWFK